MAADTRNRSLIFGIFATVVVGGVLTFAALRYFGPPPEKTPEQVLAEYRKAGLPDKVSDILLGPTPRPEKNAAVPITEAIALWKGAGRDVSKQCRELQYYGDYKNLNRTLQASAKPLAAFVQATHRPRIDFNREWDWGVGTLLPEYAQMKRAVREFAWRAEARAGLGDKAGAIEDLQAGWRVATLAGQDPNLIALLVRLSCHTIILRAAERCAAIWQDDPATLARLDEVLKENPRPLDFGFAIRGEMYLYLTTVRNIDLRSMSAPLPKPKDLVRSGLPKEERRRTETAQMMQILLDMKPVVDMYRNDPERMGIELDELTPKLLARSALGRGPLQDLLPIYAQAGAAIVKNDASTRAHRVLLAALAYRAKNGHFPARIEDIPGNWTDPFTGKPLRYRESGSAITVYSLGPNRIDDAGRPRADGTKDDDIPASYPPRALKQPTS